MFFCPYSYLSYCLIQRQQSTDTFCLNLKFPFQNISRLPGEGYPKLVELNVCSIRPFFTQLTLPLPNILHIYGTGPLSVATSAGLHLRSYHKPFGADVEIIFKTHKVYVYLFTASTFYECNFLITAKIIPVAYDFLHCRQRSSSLFLPLFLFYRHVSCLRLLASDTATETEEADCNIQFC